MRITDLRPGWRTDFILHRAGAVVTEHDDCISVVTPANPSYYWGNCLLLAQDPRDEDLGHWLQRFAQWVADGRPQVQHLAFGVNTPFAGQQLPGWQAAGLQRYVNAVMRRTPDMPAPQPRPPRGDVVVRPIDWATEVEAIVELECADVHGFEPQGYRRYRRRQFDLMQPLHDAGQLQWFGLWCDGVLAADCGLMRTQAAPGATARFQRVATHPQWRRRGLSTALVDAVARYGFDQWQAAEEVMVADPEDVAIGIYRSLGFAEFEREWLWQRKSPQDAAA